MSIRPSAKATPAHERGPRPGGRSIRGLDLAASRRPFGFAPQESMLFSDAVRNNVLFGREGLSAEQLERVVAGAELAQDVAEFPKKLDEMLGERGTRLSGGQEERVAIARALVGRPRIMVFDDATSALDAETERDLVDRLMTELRDTTAILVSHRLSVLSACDWVYVLDGGEVKEEGTHEDLLARQGLYWKLHQRQLVEQELEKLQAYFSLQSTMSDWSESSGRTVDTRYHVDTVCPAASL